MTYDAKDPDTAFPPIEPLLPPAGAPNVLVVLLDDVGYGAGSAFGGPAQHADRGAIAERRAHLQPVPHDRAVRTDPRRTAQRAQPPLGRDGHDHRDRDLGPGLSGLRPNTKAALATTLKLNGYSTAQFGKCHEVPPWQTSPVGPFDAWPTGGGGFEHFYGFIGGENNQYYPALYEGTAPIEPEKTPEEGYHLTEDLADHAIDWVRTQKALAPDKPFFVYFAPGATHAPHHVPLEWADKYAGQFAGGWDAQREAIFARQKQRGVVPAGRGARPPGPRRSRRGTTWTRR